MPSPIRLGLSLSGGGYRATAFHLGTLKKLQAMKILEKVEVISTISGGSITGAYYCLNKNDFSKFESSFQYACDIIVTCDTGRGSPGELKFSNTIALLMETVNVFMLRIKKAQMVQDVYDNAGRANKEIAYLSLGWDVENLIPGVIDNLAKEQITQTVYEAHELKPEWIADPKQYEAVINSWLDKN